MEARIHYNMPTSIRTDDNSTISWLKNAITYSKNIINFYFNTLRSWQTTLSNRLNTMGALVATFIWLLVGDKLVK